MSKEEYDVVVIGGGASGLMCAVQAAKRGLKVCILDPNRDPGRKVRITGKGRCNLTNACTVNELMKNIPGDGRFLYSALNQFGPDEVMAFFAENGLELKVERGNRVFPVSDNANDVADTLIRICRENGVVFKRTTAKKVNTYDHVLRYVVTPEGQIDCRACVIATGGLSYPLTGSTGDGYRFAETAGHTVVPTRPSLIALNCREEYCRALQGFSLKNVVLRAYEENKLIFSEMGEMLFTHFGVSGPLVLSASAHMRNLPEKKYRLEIDLKPALDDEKLDARLLRDFKEYQNKQFSNVLPGLVGRSMAPVILELCGIGGDTPVNSVTREERQKLRTVLKNFPLTVTGTRPVEEAIITAGGVSTKEINPRTMESKIVRGLYFAGEVLDLDAYTGGFNLQIAWSTGFVAGNSVLKGENS